MTDNAANPAYASLVNHPLRTVLLVLAAFAGRNCLAADAPAITSYSSPYAEFGSVERLDPALDELIAPDESMEKLAEGFTWAEGPVWVPAAHRVLFSDVPRNIAYSWEEGAGAKIFLQPSGYTGLVPGDNLGEGSNGLTLDRAGKLLLCQHGDRRISRLGDDGKSFETVVDRADGKRLNSPNDLCVDRAGNIYFTDPPYGLGDKGTREIPVNGIYRRAVDGTVTLISGELSRPNGIALSPDEKLLYVGNSDDKHPVIMAYDLKPDGTTGPGRVFFDGTELIEEGRHGLMDGMKVDARGDLWTTGPGGILIISPAGVNLGTLLTGRGTANCCFGGPDGHTLFITAQNTLLRLTTKTTGAGL